jgi:hypothetical protein
VGWLLGERDASAIARKVNGIVADGAATVRCADDRRRAHCCERHNREQEEERLLSVIGELLRA